MSSTITQCQAYEIFDSRGLPTIACYIQLSNGLNVTSKVPSGASTGKSEALELRDADDRILGKGVQKAINIINTHIAPQLIDKKINFLEMDSLLMELDHSPQKSSLGGNTLIAVSMALCKAQAAHDGLELYELLQSLSHTDTLAMPIPLFNCINGGMHANNNISIQEFFAIPHQTSFRKNMEEGVTLYHHLKRVLDSEGFLTSVGDEGGFAPNLENNAAAFKLLHKAQKLASTNCNFGIDAAASTWYDEDTQSYNPENEALTAKQLLSWYQTLHANYPLEIIEDGFAEQDWQGWQEITKSLGNEICLVGDDLFTTNPMLIRKGVLKKAGNCVLIKPNQIGTVSQMLAAVMACKKYNLSMVMSHRSGETCDTFIADAAVGCGAKYIKAGAPARGERTAKYNRLLEIEMKLNQTPQDQ